MDFFNCITAWKSFFKGTWIAVRNWRIDQMLQIVTESKTFIYQIRRRYAIQMRCDIELALYCQPSWILLAVQQVVYTAWSSLSHAMCQIGSWVVVVDQSLTVCFPWIKIGCFLSHQYARTTTYYNVCFLASVWLKVKENLPVNTVIMNDIFRDLVQLLCPACKVSKLVSSWILP